MEVAFDYTPPFTEGPAWMVQADGASPPTGRYAARLADGRVLMAGRLGGTSNRAAVYDPGQSGAGYWTNVAPLNVFRGEATVDPIDGGRQVLAVGGRTGAGITNTAERYARPPMRGRRRRSWAANASTTRPLRSAAACW